MVKSDTEGRRLLLSDDAVWPAIIIIAMAVVMAVNAAFIYIAVSGADDVAPSYVDGER